MQSDFLTQYVPNEDDEWYFEEITSDLWIVLKQIASAITLALVFIFVMSSLV